MPKIPKIPIFSTPDTPLVSTTQNYIPLLDITNDMVFFKDGGAAIILESTSLNFGLLSEREQEAVVAAYAALINSLSFSIQILVKTQRKDISSYLNYLESAAPTIINPKLQNLMDSYRKFIAETITKRKVLGKRFFIVIPFSPLELGISKSFASGLQKDDAGNKKLPFDKETILKKAKVALLPKRDHLIRQAARLGLRLTQLTNKEITYILYETYNRDVSVVKTNEKKSE